MHNKLSPAYEHELMIERRARLVTLLTGAFKTATLVILRCNADVPTRERQDKMRLAIIRAKVRGCRKYLIGRKYSQGGQVEAFYLYLDIDKEAGEEICKRWSCGPYEVKTVNTHEKETFQTDLFLNNPAPWNKPIYEPCRGIWDKVTP
jgi:hypothetical protein